MRCLHFVIPFAVALGASAAPLVSASAQIGLDVTVTAPPPELPVYEQPPLPAPGYIFTPGYWSYGDAGYFWVPGTWVEPPQPGLLWTPGYWGWNGGRYLFNTGYWGPTIGYYGGIDYGFGYGGIGYEGGYWRGGSFFYNSAVNRFGGVHVTNVYERNVTRVTTSRYAFNGPGGVTRAATAAELAGARGPHVAATAMQTQHMQMAQQNRALLASVNHGRPAAAAMSRPGLVGTPREGAPGPHPVGVTTPRVAPQDRGVTPHAGSPDRGYAAQPHPIARTPEARTPEARAPETRAPVAPHVAKPESAMAPRQPMAARPMAPRPMAPQGAMRPMGSPGTRPMAPQAAPHAAAPAAPHPAPAAHEEKH